MPDDGAFVQEVSRVLERMPDRGLIIDVRNNPGGLIWAAERMLQLLTPSPIQPTRFSLPVSELTRHLANDDLAGADLVPWQLSIEEAVGTGEAYSRPVPLTDVRLTTTWASATAVRSCASRMPAPIPRATCSRPASSTTRSAR